MVSSAAHQVVCFCNSFVVDVDAYFGLAHESIPEPVTVPHLNKSHIHSRSKRMLKTEPQESIAQQLTFDWSPLSISSARS